MCTLWLLVLHFTFEITCSNIALQFPLNKRTTILIFFTLLFTAAFSQDPRFSIGTDAGIQRNFKKEQRYWAAGHTTQIHFHLTPKNGVYVLFAYYSPGRFNNNIIATAKSQQTIPQQINYTNTGKMGLKHISIGWRKYLRGSPDIEKGWSLYSHAGFGLLLGRVDNSHSPVADTALYVVPVLSGIANFKRLTLDLGLGWEVPIGGDLFFYTEGKVWVPTTNYPSKYIFVNSNAPLVAMLSGGIRIIF